MTENAAPQPTAVTKKPHTPAQTLALAIASRQASFAQVATKYLPADRLVKLAQLVISRNPKLAECSTLSVLDALMTCARLGLEPNEPGGVWMVPYRVKGKMICQAITDYRGMLDLARRSREIAAVHAAVRFEADGWEFAIDTSSPTLVKLRHLPAEGERGDPIGAYFVARLLNGQAQAVYLTREKIEAAKARSMGADSEYSPWTRDAESMWCKTAVRRGINLLPRTADMQELREALAREDRADIESATQAQTLSAVRNMALIETDETPDTGDTPETDQV
jgi:recombination protein RecT